MIGKDAPFAKPNRHYSHLFCIFPFYSMNREQDTERIPMMKKSVPHYTDLDGDNKMFKFTGAASQWASLGDGDLAPQEQQASILEVLLKSSKWDVSNYFMQYGFDVLDHAGLFEKYGVDKMHTFEVEPGTQTVRELGPKRGSHAHGWVGSPSYQMSSRILGGASAHPWFCDLCDPPDDLRARVCQGRSSFAARGYSGRLGNEGWYFQPENNHTRKYLRRSQPAGGHCGSTDAEGWRQSPLACGKNQGGFDRLQQLDASRGSAGAHLGSGGISNGSGKC